MIQNKHKLEISKDYDAFFKHQNQQPMSDSHVQNIANLMKEVGFLPSKPIQVCKYNDKYGIIDGHHRFAAAKLLGISIYYVVEDISHADLIGRENVLVRKWSNESFSRLHASKGNKNYQTLLEYGERGIPLSIAASLLLGHSAHSGNCTKVIPSGNFKIKTCEHIDSILSVIDAVKELAPNIEKRSYIMALSLLEYVADYSTEKMVAKIQANPRAIISASDKDQALDILEEVFNFRSQIKFNLAFRAKELAKSREAFKRS